MKPQSDLEIKVKLPAGPIYLCKPCPVEVRVINRGGPVLINRRLAIGYAETLAREVYVDLLDLESLSSIAVMEVDYKRDFSLPTDYVHLDPGEHVSGSFDLFELYAPLEPGTYRFVVHYQADEPLASPPKGVVRGVYSSDPLDLEILPCRKLGPAP